MMSGRFAGRVALVTGGGRGIGAAIACGLGAEGASVMISSRSKSELGEVAERCRRSGGDMAWHETDVSRPEQVKHLIEATTDRFGSIDILVNAAGAHGAIGTIAEVPPNEWMRAVHVNLLGTYASCHYAIPVMKRKPWGRILNFAGGGATSPLPRLSSYGVAKAGVVRLSEVLAEELREHGIAVNSIAPGMVDTHIQDDVLAAGSRAGQLHEQVTRLRDSGLGGTPIELPVRLALYLASPESDGITGRLISAPHDDWSTWDKARIRSFDGTPWFTLRRIDMHTLHGLSNSGDPRDAGSGSSSSRPEQKHQR